ncbi:MAG: FliG C-terminal domain-containing protein [Hyphomicrobiaceae bacterium]
MAGTKATQPKRQQRIGELRGVDKVTALLLAMGKPYAHRIISQFDDGDIRALARSASDLPTVELDAISLLIDELVGELDKGTTVSGSSQSAQELLAGVVSDEEVDDIMDELTGQPPRRIWSKLANVSDDKIAGFIAVEQPQVAAFILSNLTAAKASSVLEKLDIDLRADLSRRLLSIKPISDRAARLVADRLTQELFSDAGDDSGGLNNHARLGAILNNLEREQITEILDRIDQVQPDDARKVKQYVFSFEDIGGLSQEDRARLFDEVPTERTVLALREADPVLCELVLEALSPRSRRMVEAELSTNAPVNRKAIAEARRGVAGLALALAEKSLIQLRPEVVELTEEGVAIDDGA